MPHREFREHPLNEKTSRLFIRPLRVSDAEALHVIHELVGTRRSRSLDELRETYTGMEALSEADNGWHGYVIEVLGGIVIGDVGVCIGRPEERQAEIGYVVHPDFWGRGYATEALEAVLSHAFARMALHRVSAVTASENYPSRALLERLQFRLEGEYREAMFDWRDEAWKDAVGYGLLASEWKCD